MSSPEYIDKIILKAAEPGMLRERKRRLLWKALRTLGCDDTSTWWVLKMNIKMWVHEKLFGTRGCE